MSRARMRSKSAGVFADEFAQRADGHGAARPHEGPAVHVAAHFIRFHAQGLGGKHGDGILDGVDLNEVVRYESPFGVGGKAQGFAGLGAACDESLHAFADERGVEVYEHVGGKLGVEELAGFIADIEFHGVAAGEIHLEHVGGGIHFQVHHGCVVLVVAAG